jgi:hypothetical protein
MEAHNMVSKRISNTEMSHASFFHYVDLIAENKTEFKQQWWEDIMRRFNNISALNMFLLACAYVTVNRQIQHKDLYKTFQIYANLYAKDNKINNNPKIMLDIFRYYQNINM